MDQNNEQQSTEPPVPVVQLPEVTPLLMSPEDQQTIKKSRKPLVIAVIIAIVVSVLLILGVLAAFIISLAEDSRVANEGAAPSSTSYKTYHNGAVAFDYPVEWKMKDTSNNTRIIGGKAVTEQAIILSSPDKPHAIVDYFMQGISTDPISYSKRLDVMTQSVVGQQQLSPSQLLTTRATAGFGCTSDAKYVQEPKLVERQKLVGLQYTYTCTSVFGPAQGVYMVWYDENGNKHSMTINILEPVDSTYQNFSSHIIDSIEVI